MDYFSLDTEATGLNAEIVLPIEFCVLFETPNDQKSYENIPKFKRYIKWPYYPFELTALKMNENIVHILRKDEGTEDQQHLVVDNKEFIFQFCDFLHLLGFKRETPDENNSLGYYYINVVGKNVANDLRIMEKVPGWKQNIKVRSSIGDPNVVYVDWYTDKRLPNLYTCKKRAGVQSLEIAHDSDLDAWDVIVLFRKVYGEPPMK